MLTNDTMQNMLKEVTCMKKIYAKICFKTLVSYGFSPSEIDILVFLSSNKTKNTSKEIACVLTISKSLVARSVDSLVKRELLTVIEDSLDKRVQRLFLTKKSEFFIQKIKERQNEFTKKIITNIDADDLLTTSKTITQINENIKELIEKENHTDENV